MINLDNIYETYIQIPDKCSWQAYIKLLRKVADLINKLKANELIEWWSFLVHYNGVPRDAHDKHMYIHIRLEIPKLANMDKANSIAGHYCHAFPSGLIRKVDIKRLEKMGGVDTDLLTDSHIEYGWQILGGSSYWILGLITMHEWDGITDRQVRQFLHYIQNALSVNELMIPTPPKKLDSNKRLVYWVNRLFCRAARYRGTIRARFNRKGKQ